jgi:hypothetical protein
MNELTTILHMLSHTPFLRKLSLYCTLDYHHIPPKLPSVKMLELWSISITDRPSAIAATMLAIQAPLCTDLSLMTCITHELYGPNWQEFSVDDKTAQNLNVLQPVIHKAHSHLRLWPRVIFGVDHIEYQHTLRQDNHAGRSREGAVLPGPAAHLIFGYVSRSPSSALQMAATAFGLQDICELVLDVQLMWTWDLPHEIAPDITMEPVFCNLPYLRYLTLRNSAELAEATLSALKHVPSPQSSIESVVCPTLETVRVLYSKVWDTQSTTSFDIMVSSLQHRARAGAKTIQLLKIDEDVSTLGLSEQETFRRLDLLQGLANQVILPPPISESK